ncbi:MAG: iron chelate uptake ABC transporter family permease subunit, partial [Bacteroidales bacterium]
FTAILYAVFNRTVVITAFDRDFALTRGVNVHIVEYSIILIISLCIVLSIKLIGIMLLLSFLSLPQMTAEIFSRRYNNIMLLSMLFAVLCGLCGLFISAFINIPASACIVFVLALMYIIARCIKKVIQ